MVRSVMFAVRIDPRVHARAVSAVRMLQENDHTFSFQRFVSNAIARELASLERKHGKIAPSRKALRRGKRTQS